MATAQLTASAVQALQDGRLAGTWTLDPSKSQISLRSKAMWGLAKVNGDFGKVTGQAVVTQAGEGVTVTGSLTVHGATRPLSIGAAVSSFDGDEVWLDAEFTVNRADFGLSWNQMGMASLDNRITVHAAFTRK